MNASLFLFFLKGKKNQKPLARINSLGRGGMLPFQMVASSPFIGITLISVVGAPLAQTEFQPVWYGFAMVFYGGRLSYFGNVCLPMVSFTPQ
jgi:hypothetical protein